MLVNTSFMSQREFNRNATSLPETIQFDNFTEAWEKANFSQYLVNSAIYATIATLIFVFTAVFVAFPIARGYIKGGNAIFLLFVIALFLPPALIPQFQLILRLGLYNTRPGYILLLVTNPVGIIILVNYLKSLPRELDESAAMDGCGYVRFMFYIVFPLSRPVIATVIVLHAIGIWNELILATIYLTDQNYYPITRGMMVFQGVYGFNWPVLAAGVVLMAIPMVILFLFLQRYIISGLTQGAVKQ
jgi:raffinose/stachyose/melibiose transport system permease protein